jgi:DNA-binding CsgD family transcriptional regulator/tetratricopeptide (TPR) repeat protein
MAAYESALSAGSVAFEGRAAELALLVAHLERSRRGLLEIALVEGEPGIGKTRLLWEVSGGLAGLGFKTLNGRGRELGGLEILGPAVEATGVDAGAGVGGLGAGGEEPGAWRYRLHQAVIDDLEERCRRGPVALLLDDLHWADAATLVFLKTLPGRLAGQPVAVVGAFRPVPRDRAFAEATSALVEAGALRLALEPLSEQAVAAIAAAILGVPPGEGLLRWAGGAGGNPLYVIELIRAAVQERRIDVRGGEAMVTSPAVPGGVRVLLERRLTALSVEAAYLLQIASVLGERFRLSELAAILGRPAGALVPALDEAIQAGILVPVGDVLGFRHDLLREVVYEDIPAPVRAGLHLDAARGLSAAGAPAATVASHLSRAADDPAAVALLLEVAPQLAPRTPAGAAELLLRALELMGGDDPRRTGVSAGVVQLLAWSGHVEAAAARAQTALAEGLDAAAEARLRVGLADVMTFQGRTGGVLEQLELAQRIPGLGDGDLAELLAAVAHARLFVGELAESKAAAEASLAAAGRAGDEASACYALSALSMALRYEGQLERGLSAAREAVARADRGPPQARQRQPRAFLAPALWSLGRFDEADEVLRAGREHAEALGSVWSLPLWAAFRAEMLRSLGRWEEACAEAEAAVQLGEELEVRPPTPLACGVLAEISVHRNDFPAATRWLDRGWAIVRGGVSFTTAWLAWGAAVAAYAAGDPSGALARLEEGSFQFGDRLDFIATDHGAAPAIVRISLAAGDEDRAQRITSLVEQTASRAPWVDSLAGAAAQCRGLIEHDQVRLIQAVERFRASGRLPALAAACEDAATALVDTGQREPAIVLFDESLRTFEGLGAALDTARVAGALRPLGVRRWHRRGKQTGATGWGSLTPSEARIAALVAEGLPNPAIASRSYISRHTVESHLKHIFLKLDISSRVELATLAVYHLGETGP